MRKLNPISRHLGTAGRRILCNTKDTYDRREAQRTANSVLTPETSALLNVPEEKSHNLVDYFHLNSGPRSQKNSLQCPEIVLYFCNMLINYFHTFLLSLSNLLPSLSQITLLVFPTYLRQKYPSFLPVSRVEVLLLLSKKNSSSL